MASKQRNINRKVVMSEANAMFRKRNQYLLCDEDEGVEVAEEV